MFEGNHSVTKVIRISNPTTIDSFCSSNIVDEVCPYSAPEILFRDRVLAECDFYSLGLIAYELMTQSVKEVLFRRQLHHFRSLSRNIQETIS
jgi:hypothetical protein